VYNILNTYHIFINKNNVFLILLINDIFIYDPAKPRCAMCGVVRGASACVADFRNNSRCVLPRHYFISIKMREYWQCSDRLRLEPIMTQRNNGLISTTVTIIIPKYIPPYASLDHKRTDGNILIIGVKIIIYSILYSVVLKIVILAR